jgi:hypothetical protein
VEKKKISHPAFPGGEILEMGVEMWVNEIRTAPFSG